MAIALAAALGGLADVGSASAIVGAGAAGCPVQLRPAADAGAWSATSGRLRSRGCRSSRLMARRLVYSAFSGITGSTETAALVRDINQLAPVSLAGQSHPREPSMSPDGKWDWLLRRQRRVEETLCHRGPGGLRSPDPGSRTVSRCELGNGRRHRLCDRRPTHRAGDRLCERWRGEGVRHARMKHTENSITSFRLHLACASRHPLHHQTEVRAYSGISRWQLSTLQPACRRRSSAAAAAPKTSTRHRHSARTSLLYRASGSPRAVRFDPVKLEVLGDPVTVVDQV